MKKRARFLILRLLRPIERLSLGVHIGVVAPEIGVDLAGPPDVSVELPGPSCSSFRRVTLPPF